jgi:O-antigen/teichoic acid export membrane protein
LKNIYKNIFFFLSASGISKAAYLISNVILLFYLASDIVGQWISLYLILQFGLHMHFGILNGYNQIYPQYHNSNKLHLDRQELNATFVYMVIFMIVSYLLVGLFILSFEILNNTIVFVIIIAIMQLIYQAQISYLRAREKVIDISKYESMKGLLGLCLIVLPLKYEIYGYLAREFFINLFLVVYYHINNKLNFSKSNFSFTKAKKLLDIGFPIMVSGVLSLSIFSLDRIYLSFESKVGQYSLIVYYSATILLVLHSIYFVVYTNMIKIYAKNGNKEILIMAGLKRSLLITLACFIILLFGDFIINSVLVDYLSQYEKSADAIKVSFLYILFFSLSLEPYYINIVTGKTGVNILIALVSILLFIVLISIFNVTEYVNLLFAMGLVHAVHSLLLWVSIFNYNFLTKKRVV